MSGMWTSIAAFCVFSMLQPFSYGVAAWMRPTVTLRGMSSLQRNRGIGHSREKAPLVVVRGAPDHTLSLASLARTEEAAVLGLHVARHARRDAARRGDLAC